MMWLHIKLSRSEEHTSELQSHLNLVCRLLLEKKKYTCASTSTRQELQTRRERHNTHHSAPTPSRTATTDTHPPTHTHTRTTSSCFFFNDTATTEIYTLSLPDALPI